MLIFKFALTSKTEQTKQNLENHLESIKKSNEFIEKSNQKVYYLFVTNYQLCADSIEFLFYKVSFEISESPLNRSIIGVSDRINELFAKHWSKRFEIVSDLINFIALPNNKSVLVYCDKICLYENWSESPVLKNEIKMKIIHEPNIPEMMITDATADNEAIYYTTSEAIVKTDLDLNEVKRFDKLPKLPKAKAAIKPDCIAYFKNFLYCPSVLSTKKTNIIKLTTDLELVELVPFKKEISIIKIASNGIACMKLTEKEFYGFYDVQKDFAPLTSSKTVCDGISLWNDEFYITTTMEPDSDYSVAGEIKLKCFKNTGELKSIRKVERVTKALFSDLTLNFNGCLVSAFESLVEPDMIYDDDCDDEDCEDCDDDYDEDAEDDDSEESD
jgi:hypothetical protein